MKTKINRILFIFFTVCTCLSTTSCEGLFDGIYDEPMSLDTDSAKTEGFMPYTGDQAMENRYLLKLKATEYDEWIYVDLHQQKLERKPIPTKLTGEWDGRSGLTYNEVKGTLFTPYKTVNTDTQEEAEHWDFAVHHFDVKTNGGAAWSTPYWSMEELMDQNPDLNKQTFTRDIWSTTHAIVDLKEMMGFRVGYQNTMVNVPLTGWVIMDFSNPPPVYTFNNNVRILRMSDGTYAALRMLSYMNTVGLKGYLTFDVIYPYTYGTK